MSLISLGEKENSQVRFLDVEDNVPRVEALFDKHAKILGHPQILEYSFQFRSHIVDLHASVKCGYSGENHEARVDGTTTGDYINICHEAGDCESRSESI